MRLKLSPSVRVAAGLLSVAATLLLALDLLVGIFPAPHERELLQRAHVAERIGAQIATAHGLTDVSRLSALTARLIGAEPTLRSIALRREDGDVIVATPAHAAAWAARDLEAQGRDWFTVPIVQGQPGRRWGQVEVSFVPLSGGPSWWSPAMKSVLLFSAIGALAFYLYLRRAFQYLDPSSVVPERVQHAFDALAEGVIVLDQQEHIVMANQAFRVLCRRSGIDPMGRKPQDFDWLRATHADAGTPWQRSMKEKQLIQGAEFEVLGEQDRTLKLIVSSSPVLDGHGAMRGAMVSFSDVTELDAAHRRLLQLTEELSASARRLEVQNDELHRLANADPMTGAMNRRSFFPLLTARFDSARTRARPLSVVMADIDKFKSVNDVYGHAAGDRVIQKFSALMMAAVREGDVVCRYGGEEFCIALPGADLHTAMQVAERIRQAVEKELKFALEIENPHALTGSFGVAQLTDSAATAALLVEQADQALYVAKRSGRNRCVGFGTEAMRVGVEVV